MNNKHLNDWAEDEPWWQYVVSMCDIAHGPESTSVLLKVIVTYFRLVTNFPIVPCVFITQKSSEVTFVCILNLDELGKSVPAEFYLAAELGC